MRFKTEEQSSDACSILGSTLAFGNNDRQLRVGKTSLLRDNSTMRIFSVNNSEENPFRKRTSRGVLEFWYNLSN